MQKFRQEHVAARKQHEAVRIEKLKKLLARNLVTSQRMLAEKKKSGNVSGMAAARTAIRIFTTCSEGLEKGRDFKIPDVSRRDMKASVQEFSAAKDTIENDYILDMEEAEAALKERFIAELDAQGTALSEEELTQAFQDLLAGTAPPIAPEPVAPGGSVPLPTDPADPVKPGPVPVKPGPPREIGTSGAAATWAPFAHWYASVSSMEIVRIPVMDRRKVDAKTQDTALGGGTFKTLYVPVRVLPLAGDYRYRIVSLAGRFAVDVLEWPTRRNGQCIVVRIRPQGTLPSEHGLELQVGGVGSGGLEVVGDAPAPAAPAPGSMLDPVDAPEDVSAPPVAAPSSTGRPVSVPVRSVPSGAYVLLDGKPARTRQGYRTTPCTLRIPPGQHTISLRMRGYQEWSTGALGVKPGTYVDAELEKETRFAKKSLRVRAARPWISSGIRVNRGDRIKVDVTGSWSCAPSGIMVGPRGYPNEQAGPRQVPGERYGALLMRIGDRGRIRVVGSELRATAASAGFVYFDINESPGAARNDNEGGLSLSIEKAPGPR